MAIFGPSPYLACFFLLGPEPAPANAEHFTEAITTKLAGLTVAGVGVSACDAGPAIIKNGTLPDRFSTLAQMYE